MFGALRFLLALAVAVDHTSGTRIATFAVPMFFVVSGYLMTAVMRGTYGYGVGGVGRFFLNRGLRLMPPYWVAAALALVVARAAGPGILADPTWRMPATVGEALRLGTLVTLDGAEPFIANPPVWSLPIEELFYAAMAVGASRTLPRTLGWLAVSIAIRIAWWGDAGFDERYHAAWFASLWFALGALAWYARGRIPPRVGLAGLAGVAAARVVPGWFGHGFDMVEIYNAPVVVAMVCWAATISALGPVRAPRWDRVLGDLSYPVYLFHWPVAVAAARALGIDAKCSELGVVAAAATLALAVVVDRFVARPVDRLRARFREPVRSAAPVVCGAAA